MATLTFTFDTGSVPISRIVDGMATYYNYQVTVLGPNGAVIPNPESKQAFGRRMVKESIIRAVREAEANAAASAVVQIGLD